MTIPTIEVNTLLDTVRQDETYPLIWPISLVYNPIGRIGIVVGNIAIVLRMA